MVQIRELAAYIDDFLDSMLFKDYAPNGLQIEGRTEILKLATAVTASQEAINLAIEWGADALLVHHGYFWKGESSAIVGMKRQRIRQLLINDINLLAYHLPLDCHLEIGNNSCLAKILSLESLKQHTVGGVDKLLWTGSLNSPLEPSYFEELISIKLGRKPLHISANKKLIRSVALCSGGAQDFIFEAAQLGVDAYISGEVSERTYYQAKELKLHYFACGHHATEKYGVQALGEHLANQFSIEHQYFDSANPI